MQLEAMTIGDKPAIKITIEINEVVIMSQEEAAMFMGVAIVGMKEGDRLDELYDMVRRLPRSSNTMTAQQRLAVATWRRYMGEIFPPENGGR
jgi:hypothetical protein